MILGGQAVIERASVDLRIPMIFAPGFPNRSPESCEWWAATTGNTACAARAIGFGEVSVNNINSDLTVVNAMRLGLVGSLSIPANAGSIYFDDFESFR